VFGAVLLFASASASAQPVEPGPLEIPTRGAGSHYEEVMEQGRAASARRCRIELNS
jgi:hypothetical protein